MLLTLLACTAADVADGPSELSVRFDDVRTNVAHVTWRSGAAVEGRVRWEAEDGIAPPTRTSTPAVEASEHVHTVFGLRPGVGYTLYVEQGGQEVESTYVRVPEAPSWVPEFRLMDGSWDGFVAVPYHSLEDDENHGIVMLDGLGTPVWWEQTPSFATTAVWQDGRLMYNVQLSETESWICSSELLGAPDCLDVPRAHHEFLPLPDGALAFLRTDVRDVDGEPVMGDELVLRSADGAERVVWNAFDTLDVTWHEAWETGAEGGDWTHANGVAYDAATDRWVVSLYWLRQLLEIDGATGQILRVLDGALAAERFGPQHAPKIAGDGLLFFDNELMNGQSRLLEIGWDGQMRWMWTPPEQMHALVLGDVDRLPDGRVLSSWGPERRIIGIASGEIPTFAVEIEMNVLLGQVGHRDDLYE